MTQKDASYLLFVRDFGKGPLFKNQTELATDLVNEPHSFYYVIRSDSNNHSKSLSKVKAYLSQLFSTSTRRNVTNEFRTSLQKVLENKNLPQVDLNNLVHEIITDLREKNNPLKSDAVAPLDKRDSELYVDFLNNIVEAKYVAVFTAREIRFEYEAIGQKFSFADFLIQDLIDSLKKERSVKYYRFNFPLLQTCQLFWRGLRKEISKYLKAESSTLGELMAVAHKNRLLLLENYADLSSTNKDIEIEKTLASGLLEYLSKNNVINVYHLKQPVYLTPSIATNPNGGQEQNTYILLQSPDGEELVHKFSNEEFIFWKLFVWDNLKGNKQGDLIKYSNAY